MLRPVSVGDGEEMPALIALSRKLLVNVVRVSEQPMASVLPRGEPRAVELKPAGEVSVNLFFDSKFRFKEGDSLRLDVRDAETGEMFPGPDGITLRVARDL